MKCCICGCELNDYGNNPYPLCAEDDRESRCCNECDSHVIQARLISMRGTKKVEVDKLVVIFYSKNSTSPMDILKANGKFLAGKATKQLSSGCWEGEWGDFILNTKVDTYIVVEDK